MTTSKAPNVSIDVRSRRGLFLQTTQSRRARCPLTGVASLGEYSDHAPCLDDLRRYVLISTPRGLGATHRSTVASTQRRRCNTVDYRRHLESLHVSTTPRVREVRTLCLPFAVTGSGDLAFPRRLLLPKSAGAPGAFYRYPIRVNPRINLFRFSYHPVTPTFRRHSAL